MRLTQLYQGARVKVALIDKACPNRTSLVAIIFCVSTAPIKFQEVPQIRSVHLIFLSIFHLLQVFKMPSVGKLYSVPYMHQTKTVRSALASFPILI